MKLVIFDIDGTLVRSDPHEDRLFWQALVEVLGVERENFDWSSFPHVTDSGITHDVFRRQFGRDPAPDALTATEAYFARLWRQLLAGLREEEVAVPGGKAMLDILREDPQWVAAVATGGWGLTARAKLSAAGIDHEALPLACANDAKARQDIMAVAKARAENLNGNKAFERVVYVGDGHWDVKTCRTMGMPLVGMATEPEIYQRLEGAGVSHILEDYRNPTAVFEALEEACVPAV